jgi:uroporphyrinogen-III synthase
MRKKIAITCTSPRCDQIVSDLQNDNIRATAHPILSITHTNTSIPTGDFDVVLISSVHAITDDLPKHLPYIAVGAQTATYLSDKGFVVTQIGKGGVADIDLSNYNRVLYPCAEYPSFTPSKATPWIVYSSHVDTNFSWVTDMDMIAVFSKMAARVLLPYVQPHIQILCLSQPIANVFDGHSSENLAICGNPHYDDMKFLIQSMTRTDTNKGN